MACEAPIRDRTKTVSYAGVAGGIIALIAFILRMIARLRCCGGTFGMDDWTMALTMVCLIHFQSKLNSLADSNVTGSCYSTISTLCCL